MARARVATTPAAAGSADQQHRTDTPVWVPPAAGLLVGAAAAGATALALRDSTTIPARTGAALVAGVLTAGAVWWIAHTWTRHAAPEAAPAPAPTPPPSASPGPAPEPSPPVPTGADPDSIRVGQLNAGNLFDTVDEPRRQDDVLAPADLDRKLGKLALALRDTMGSPDVVTLQEVENLDVLQQLAARPELAGLGYEAALLEGIDPRGIDVGILFRRDRLALHSLTQSNGTSHGPSGYPTPTFTRPPLIATFAPRGAEVDAATGAGLVTVITNHFTSQLQGERGQERRLGQAGHLAGIVDARRAAQPGELLIVTGDLNETPTGPAYAQLVQGLEGTPRLASALEGIEPADRYTWRSGRRREQLDHVLVPAPLASAVTGASVPHINTEAPAAAATQPDTPAGSSDHDPVVTTLSLHG